MTPASAAPATTFPPVPVTAEQLAAKWARSDALYVGQQLDPSTIANIRNERMKEAGRLPNVDERARMYARAQTWAAPLPAEFGSLKDWLSE